MGHPEGAGELGLSPGRPIVRAARSARRALSLAIVAAAALLSLATSAPQSARRYPTWGATPDAQSVDGAVVRAWVSRSGREGVGISVEIDPRDTGLPFEVDEPTTTLRFAKSSRTIRPTRVVPADAPPDRRRFYVTMRFDGLAAWNAGDRRALLHLGLRSPAGTRAVLVWLTHSLPAPHARRDAAQPTAGGAR